MINETKKPRKQNGFTDEVRQHIELRLSELESCKTYVVGGFFEKEIWDCFTDGERRKAGQVVSRLVKDKYLPLVYVGKVKGNTRAYRID